MRIGRALGPLFLGIGVLHAMLSLTYWRPETFSVLNMLDLSLGTMFVALGLWWLKRPKPNRLIQGAFCGLMVVSAASVAIHNMHGVPGAELTMLMLILGAGFSLVAPQVFLFLLAVFWAIGFLPGIIHPSVSERLFLFSVTTLAAVVAYLTLRLRHVEVEAMREITEQVDDIIWSANPEFIFTYASRNIERITGWSVDDLVGRTLREMIIEGAGSSRLDFDSAVAAIEAGEAEGFSLEVLHDCRDKGSRWFDVHGRVLRSDDGQLLAIHGVTREVHERHLFESALRASEARYRNLTERALDPIISFDAEGYMTYANPASELLWGLKPAELIGGHYHFALAKSNRDEADAALERLRNGETEVEQLEQRHQLKDGSWVWSELRAWPIRDQLGRFDGFQFVSRDVTERKENAELLSRQRIRLSERAEQLAELNQKLDRFAAMVSHDLQGPLRRMATRLRQSQLSANDSRYLQDQLHSVQALVDHILDTARTHKGLMCEFIDLGGLVRELVSKAGMETGRACTLEAPRPNEAVMWADRKLVELLLSNLIMNAYNYAPADRELELSVTQEKHGRETVYTVSDNGDGFPVEHISLLFEPFQRADVADDRAGYGIGLSTVEQIVKQHGGQVTLKNNAEGGASVTFSLGEQEDQHGNSDRSAQGSDC